MDHEHDHDRSDGRSSGRRRAAGAAVAALALLAAAGAAGAAATKTQSSGWATDLAPSTAGPLDDAHVHVKVTPEPDGSTTVWLHIVGVDHAVAGTTFGAHLHTGTCVEGNGAAAGPHFNHTGGSVISPATEVWLDFTVGAGGEATSEANVPFTVPEGGAHAVVIHALPTNPTTGAAGARIACLPVDL